jgi:hypothetical protein
MSDHTYRVEPYFREDDNRFTLYAARCVCGWKSAGWFTEAGAQRQGEQHYVTAPHDGAA